MAGILSNGMHIQLVPLYLPSFLLKLSRVVSIRAVVASRVLARRIKENPPWNTVRAPESAHARHAGTARFRERATRACCSIRRLIDGASSPSNQPSHRCNNGGIPFLAHI